MTTRSIILFGSGRDGKEALEFFGEENVFCYVDNDSERIGTLVNNKKIISISDLKTMLDDTEVCFEKTYEVVITIGITKWAMFTVAHQLKKIGLEVFSVYNDIKKRWKSGIEYISRDVDIYSCEQESILEIYKYQLEWMLRHTNASDLKPATGKIRDEQIECMTGLKWILNKTEPLDLHFIMNHGTLIGALRHKGFIPWDDDMDLALMSDEYECFLRFCEEDDDIMVFYNCYDDQYLTKDGEKSVSAEKYPYVVALGRGYIQLFKNIEEEHCKRNRLITDIMPLYYISDEVSMDDYAREHNKYTAMRRQNFDLVDRIFTEETYEWDMYPEVSHQVGYKYDFTSFFDWYVSKTGRTMQTSLWRADYLFPIEKAKFEDVTLWMPRRAVEWVEQINPGQDIMAIPPKSVGIPVHYKDDLFTEIY